MGNTLSTIQKVSFEDVQWDNESPRSQLFAY